MEISCINSARICINPTRLSGRTWNVQEKYKRINMTRSRTWINIRLMVQFLFKWRIQILTLTVTSYIQSTLVPVWFYERSTICYTNLKSMNKLISRWYITIILQEKNTGKSRGHKKPVVQQHRELRDRPSGRGKEGME